MGKLIITLFFSCFMLSSHGHKCNECGDSNQVFVVKTVYSDLSFGDFVKKFSKEKAFQLSSIKFPLVCRSINDDETGSMTTALLNKKDWVCVNLVDKSSFGEPVTFNETVKNKNTVELLVLGVDTGIHITYLFKKGKDGWLLVEIVDASN